MRSASLLNLALSPVLQLGPVLESELPGTFEPTPGSVLAIAGFRPSLSPVDATDVEIVFTVVPSGDAVEKVFVDGGALIELTLP